jgi:hypothetical protein
VCCLQVCAQVFYCGGVHITYKCTYVCELEREREREREGKRE